MAALLDPPLGSLRCVRVSASRSVVCERGLCGTRVPKTSLNIANNAIRYADAMLALYISAPLRVTGTLCT